MTDTTDILNTIFLSISLALSSIIIIIFTSLILFYHKTRKQMLKFYKIMNNNNRRSSLYELSNNQLGNNKKDKINILLDVFDEYGRCSHVDDTLDIKDYFPKKSD